jgi:hypothetical protein
VAHHRTDIAELKERAGIAMRSGLLLPTTPRNLHPEPSGIVGFEEQILLSVVPGAAIRCRAVDVTEKLDPNDISWVNRRAAARPLLAALAVRTLLPR